MVMAKAMKIGDMAKAFRAAAAVECATVYNAVLEIDASDYVSTVRSADSVTVSKALRRERPATNGSPLRGMLVECTAVNGTAFALVPFISLDRGLWLVLGDHTSFGRAIDGMVSNDGDPVKLVRRVVRAIAKRETHLRLMT